MRIKKLIKTIIGITLMIVFLILTIFYLDLGQLWDKTKEFFFGHPILILMITISYFSSFLLRAIAWKKYLNNRVKLLHCLQGVLFSLFINHIIPIKIGDLARIGILVKKEKDITLDEATHSVLILRVLDIFTLISFTFLGLILNSKKIILNISILGKLLLIFMAIVVCLVIRKRMPNMFNKHLALLKKGLFTSNSLIIVPLVLVSWLLEGSVLWGVMKSYEEEISFWKAVWVNSITVGGQVFQITPGGITTYESVMSIALSTIGVPIRDAYQIAFVSHGYKFVFSYAVGIIMMLQAPKAKWREVKELLGSRGGFLD